MKYLSRFIFISMFIFSISTSKCITFSFGDKKVITSEEIQHAGITRIADILLLIDNWNLSTIDGYTWLANANNLSSYQGQNWIVILDGQKFDLNSFDVKILNFLPVTIDQIDFVEIINTPKIYKSEFTEKGIIHFHTKRPEKGFSLQVYQMGGNITGEPGPYEGSEFSTPDIQRIGRDASYSFDYKLNNWYFRTYFIRHFHPFQDIAMIKRNTKILEDPPGNGSRENRHLKLWFEDTDRPKMLRNSLSLRVGKENKTRINELQIDYSYSYRYFLFFKPIGREIPVNDFYTRIGISGNPFISDNLTYRFQYFLKELEKHPNALDFDFKWRSHNFQGIMEKSFMNSFFNGKIGIGYDRFILDTEYHLEKDYFDMYRLYNEIKFNVSKKIYQNLNGMLLYSNNKTALKGSIINFWEINSLHSLNTVLSYSQRLFEEDNSLWFWTEKGYNILEEYNVEYTVSKNIDKSSQLTFDIIWKTAIKNRFIIKLNSVYRNFYDTYIERQSFEFNPQDGSFSSPLHIYAGQNGQVLGQQLTLTYWIKPQIKQSFYYSYQFEVGEDEIFKETWKSIPKHKAIYKITYSPDLNFSIWAKLSYLSSTFWIDYKDIDGQTYYSSNEINEKYYSTVESTLILDLQIQKWFWQRRLSASLLLRNVGDQDFRYHPIGASFGLTYYIQLRLFLNF
ncbi:MAG: hypothetical protein KAU01_04505 [Candidatus Cloacimonetes bacterium]|nr:hypothetical protein [Candidatus Cloacimonadota bacterium]